METNWIELIERYKNDGWNCEIHFVSGNYIRIDDLDDVIFIGDGILCNYKGDMKIIGNDSIKDVAI